MYETCIFDLYGTLVDIRTDENKKELWDRLALFYAFYGADYTPDELHRAYDRLTKEMSAGKGGIRKDAHEAYPEIRIEEVFQALFQKKGADADEVLARHAGQFFRILSMEHLKLYNGTEEMLSALRKRGKKIYLLSNAQQIFTEYEMNALKITPYFDGIFISSEHGCKKPDTEFFEKLIRTCNIDRKGAVMIGNDGMCDIEGAKKAELATVYIRTEISPKEEFPEADYVLKEMDMKKLTEILLAEG
ncbi:MAG TPA: HAD family hydrolase [Candidatus Mediterraneibacter gallistercoris]|uniref:HAD family hydrolase n=1 Tax=Candidatus Mediterraneibacter gallistercoris TaxID=2838671 RepID=A0A9D2P465_9FIRM|nr:HAD family hydrolase [Candidatus Mediterraneibacter gallistercoris]